MEPSENKTSSWVESRLKKYLSQIEKDLNREDDLAFVDNLMRYSKGFWKGLFTFTTSLFYQGQIMIWNFSLEEQK